MASDLELNFCKLCVKTGVLTKEQVQSAIKVQQTEAPNKNLPQILVEQSVLTPKQVEVLKRRVLEGENVTVAIPSTDPLLGKMLGKCLVQQLIGRGGMGAVYKGLHKSLNCPVAIKVLPPELEFMDPSYVHRFVREARVAARINHHNIVRVMDVGKNAEIGCYYIIMEYVDGTSVGQLLKKQGRMAWQKAYRIVTSVTEALKEAAKHNIIHRDIKPDNIMLTADGVAKLADLGLAKRAGTNELGLTLSGIAIGTPYYMSPEQARDARTCDCRSDIYSLGATFYHMLTGRVPFSGNSAYEVLSKHEHDALPAPQLIVPDLPVFVSGIIERMMAKNPDNRYQTVDELLDELLANKESGVNGVSISGVIEEKSLHEDVLKALTGFKAEEAAEQERGRHAWIKRSLAQLLIYALAAGAVIGLTLLWDPLVAWARRGEKAPPASRQQSPAEVPAEPATEKAAHKTPAKTAQDTEQPARPDVEAPPAPAAPEEPAPEPEPANTEQAEPEPANTEQPAPETPKAEQPAAEQPEAENTAPAQPQED